MPALVRIVLRIVLSTRLTTMAYTSPMLLIVIVMFATVGRATCQKRPQPGEVFSYLLTDPTSGKTVGRMKEAAGRPGETLFPTHITSNTTDLVVIGEFMRIKYFITKVLNETLKGVPNKVPGYGNLDFRS